MEASWRLAMAWPRFLGEAEFCAVHAWLGTTQLCVGKRGEETVELETLGAFCDVQAARFSPASQRLAVVGKRLDAPMDRLGLYTCAPDGSDPRLVVRTRDAIDDVWWSPDGSQLLFDKLNGPVDGLYLAHPDQESVRCLVPRAFTPAWSPDGSQLAYCTSNRGQEQLCVRGLTEDDEQFLVSGFAPAWSPDGTQLAFVDRGSQQHGSVRLGLLQLASRERRWLSALGEEAWYPRWLPDGQSLVFSLDGSICQHELARGQTRCLLERPGRDLWIEEVSDDGRWLSIHSLGRRPPAGGESLLFDLHQQRSLRAGVLGAQQLPALRAALQARAGQAPAPVLRRMLWALDEHMH